MTDLEEDDLCPTGRSEEVAILIPLSSLCEDFMLLLKAGLIQ